MPKVKTTRVQLDLPDDSYKRLQNLKKETEAVSFAEVIRNAFIVYERLVDLEKKGVPVHYSESGGGVQTIRSWNVPTPPKA